MTLSRKNGPLYIQIKSILKSRIVNHVYPVQSLMPSESVLEREFGVSKITVRNAMEQLTIEGYVEKRSGVGTIVLDNAAVIKMSTGKSFTNHLMQEGKSVVKKVLSLSTNQATPTFMETDLTHSSFTQIERIYYLDKQPYIYMTHYIPSYLGVPTDSALYETSLYDVLNQLGIQFDRFSDAFQVATPPARVSSKLQIKQGPLLLRSRYAYDTNGSLIEYSIAYYETNMHSYVINFNV